MLARYRAALLGGRLRTLRYTHRAISPLDRRLFPMKITDIKTNVAIDAAKFGKPK